MEGSRGGAFAGGPASFQKGGSPSPISAPRRAVLDLFTGITGPDSAHNASATCPAMGVIAVELDRRSTCGPVLVNGMKTLFPGEVYILGDSNTEEIRLESPYAALVAGTKAALVANYGELRATAHLILHTDLRTIPPTATRAFELAVPSILNAAVSTGATETELVQVIAEGYSRVLALAWSRTGGTTFEAAIQWVWIPSIGTQGPVSFFRIETSAFVLVPPGATVGAVVYDGDTRGATIIRLVQRNAVAADTGFGQLKLRV